MKTTFKIAVAALAMLGTTSAARADLTYQGAVGLPLNPTAQIPLPGGVRVQADYFDLGQEFNSDAKFYGIHGAGRLGDRLEINGGVSKLDADGFFEPFDRTGIDIGAKYLFTRETDPAGIRIAAGAGYSHALLKNIHAYVVGSKSFGRGITGNSAPITGHLGLRYDRFKFDTGFSGDNSSKVSVYGGLEVPFTRTGDFALVGELQSKNVEENGKFPYSASVRYRPAGQGFSASVGIQRQGLLRDNGIFAQIGYSFGHSDDNAAAAAETTPLQ
jgi:hypothetical protein